MKFVGHARTTEVRNRERELGASVFEYLIALLFVAFSAVLGQSLLVEALNKQVERMAHTIGGGTSTVINGGVECYPPYIPVPGGCLSPDQDPELYVPHNPGRPNGGDLDATPPPP